MEGRQADPQLRLQLVQQEKKADGIGASRHPGQDPVPGSVISQDRIYSLTLCFTASPVICSSPVFHPLRRQAVTIVQTASGSYLP